MENKSVDVVNKFIIPRIRLNFHPKEIFLPSTKDYKLAQSEYPVYTNIFDYSYYNVSYTAIIYRIYFIYNGAIGKGYHLFPNSQLLGFHEIDSENIVILLDKQSSKPVFVFFSAHRNEGKWYKWEECKFTDNNELEVYVALNSHALYNDYGTWWRFLSFGNDETSIRGYKINPVYIHDPDMKYNLYNYEKKSKFIDRFFSYSE
jgi:hypothetical protein